MAQSTRIGSPVIDLNTCKTANGYRASIALEECGLPYVAHAMDLPRGDCRTPAFLAINPMGRVPAIVDDDAPGGGRLALAETLAITLYASEKSGLLMPASVAEKALAWQWSAVVVSGFSAAAAGIFFSRQLGADDHVKIIAKFFADIRNYLAAMEGQLARTTYLAGDTITFADLMAIPTIVRSLPAMDVDLQPFPAVRRWADLVGARPAVVRGLAVP